MNYAILNKARVTSTLRPQEVIELSKNVVRLLRPSTLAETTFYLSASDYQAYYMLTLWYQLPSPQEIENYNKSAAMQEIAANATVEDVQTFRMVWDYRRLDVALKYSHLSLMTFPPEYDQAKINLFLTRHRKLSRDLPGMVGCWYGSALDTRCASVLERMDWSELGAQQAFFQKSKPVQPDSKGQPQGIVIELASFDLSGIVSPEEIQVPDSTAEKR